MVAVVVAVLVAVLVVVMLAVMLAIEIEWNFFVTLMTTIVVSRLPQ